MATNDKPIPGLTLTNRASGRSLVVEETNPGDIYVETWVADPDDGRSVLLSLPLVRKLYTAMGDRLELLEGQR
jgi:hypothetical protein